MDLKVRDAQKFINSTYNNGKVLGISSLPENGKTSWSVMYALIRALQHELGISAKSDAFGPTTLSTLQTKFPTIDKNFNGSPNIIKIIQSGLYCKGYEGGNIDGKYSSVLESSIKKLKDDMGVSSVYPGAGIEPKVFRGILNMDPYVLIPGGSDKIRKIQQWLNGKYIKRRDFQIIPTEGFHSRTVAQCMLFAIQYETGMPDGVANGIFGPGTQASLKNRTLRVGSSGVWAQLFTAAMILNKRNVNFGNFTSSVESAVKNFQSFTMLPVTGLGDYATWASLLVSYGDKSRAGTACDGVTMITAPRAKELSAAGYTYIGRYLYNPSTKNLLEKQLQPGELEIIASHGMRCFPIYQTFNNYVDYFTPTQGSTDAEMAVFWARKFGFKPGTIIYFSVDYDALDGEVTSNIIPYFRSINNVLKSISAYKIGVYGARNVCQRIADSKLAVTSFVCDMSSGFSGNLGYPLPTNWAFDQIDTIALGSGSSYIEIDKNIASGRDLGQNSFIASSSSAKLDVNFISSFKDALLIDVQRYLISVGVPETGGVEWEIDDDWVTYGGISTTEALERVLSKDELITDLARSLGVRKALIQAPIVWELRKWNPSDFAKDAAVDSGLAEDSSTGWAQIFAASAILGWNYCVDNRIISGDKFNSEQELYKVWSRLRSDVDFNIRCSAYLHFYNANILSLKCPSIASSASDIQKLIARYNGTGNKAEEYGRDVKGLYNVLENYNAISRK